MDKFILSGVFSNNFQATKLYGVTRMTGVILPVAFKDLTKLDILQTDKKKNWQVMKQISL